MTIHCVNFSFATWQDGARPSQGQVFIVDSLCYSYLPGLMLLHCKRYRFAERDQITLRTEYRYW